MKMLLARERLAVEWAFSLPGPAVSGAVQCLIANYYSNVASGILIREVDIFYVYYNEL